MKIGAITKSDHLKGWVEIIEGSGKGFDVQILAFGKDKFSEDEAKSWASEHDFKSDHVETEADGEIQLRQFDFDEIKYVRGISSTFVLDDGVKALVFKIRDGSDPKLDTSDEAVGRGIKSVKKKLNKAVRVIAQVDRKSIDRKKRTVTGWLSVEEVDRFDELMLASAFDKDLPLFRENPVMLWGHDHSLPAIGHFSEIESVSGKGLKFVATYAKSPLANEVFNLYAEGHLRGFSVGFIPREIRQATEEDKESFGSSLRNVIVRAELIEGSSVNVPAVPHALAERGFKPGDAKGLENLYALLRGIHENVEGFGLFSKQGTQERAVLIAELAGQIRLEVERGLAAIEADENAAEVAMEVVTGLDTWTTDIKREAEALVEELGPEEPPEEEPEEEQEDPEEDPEDPESDSGHEEDEDDDGKGVEGALKKLEDSVKDYAEAGKN